MYTVGIHFPFECFALQLVNLVVDDAIALCAKVRRAAPLSRSICV